MDGYELLAPAGDMECLETAIRYGADAVYIGGPELQLRSGKVGFDRGELERAVSYAHLAGRRVYVTVNSFAFDREIALVPDYARYLSDIGADAVIVTDIGVLAEIRKSAPCLPVHVSTQANCMNYRAACVYRDMGASRVILARELSLSAIARIRANTP